MSIHHLTLMRSESDPALEDSAWRGCVAFILGDTRIPAGHSSEQLTLADPVLSRELD